MELRRERRDGTLLVAPVGRIDSNSSTELERDLIPELEAGEKRWVVDLSEVDYISSAGLRLFLVIAKRLQKGSGRLALCSMNESVKQVFELAGFMAIFTVEDDADAALKRVNEPA